MKPLLFLAVYFALTVPAFAQLSRTVNFNGSGAPAGACVSGSTYVDSTTGFGWQCVGLAWVQKSGGAVTDKGGQVYNVLSEGLACDGVTDDTAALTTLLGIINTAGGGTVLFPAGKVCLLASHLLIPNNNTAIGSGGSNYSRQPFIRLTGAGGDAANGQGQQPAAGLTGSELLLTYSGAGVAKIETYGMGELEIDHLTLFDSGTDTLPWISSTATTLRIHNNSFIGSVSDASADQDVLLLGGTNTTPASLNDPLAAFQGYDTTIYDNYFNRVRRIVYVRAYGNGIHIHDNYIGPETGTNLANGAPIELDGTSGENGNNHIYNNRCEITWYYYCIKLINSNNNYMAGMDVEDNFGNNVTGIYSMDATSTSNFASIMAAPNSATMTYQQHVSDLNGANTVIDASPSAPSFLFSGKVILGAPAITGMAANQGIATGLGSAGYTSGVVSPPFFCVNGAYENAATPTYALDRWCFGATETNSLNGLSNFNFTHSGSTAAQLTIPFTTIIATNTSIAGGIIVANGGSIVSSAGAIKGATIQTGSNCSSSASPAVCGSAAAGSVALPTNAVSSSIQVNTTAVTANSQIIAFTDDTLGTKLGVTCNSTVATLVGGLTISARSAGASFTIANNSPVTTNPLCVSYLIVN